VIKIRLQLQVHSLSDPLSIHGIIGPTYKGTLGTLKHILREEGITVRRYPMKDPDGANADA